MGGTGHAATEPAETPADSTVMRRDMTVEHRFILGLTLANSGRAREAAAIFSDILASDPELHRVRLELARAHFLSRRWGRARREFLSVLSEDIPAPVRANVLRFLREIDGRRGLEWNADIAVVTLGDTRDYESDTILVPLGGSTLPFRLDGRDGTTTRGLRYSLSGGYRQIVPGLSGPRAHVLGFGRLVTSGDEAPGSRFDDLTLTGESGLRSIWPRATLSVALRLSRRFLAGDSFEDRTGVRTSYRRRTPKGTDLGISVGRHIIDNHGSEARDGHISLGGLSISRPLSSTVTLGGRLSIEDRDASSAPDDYLLTRLSAFGILDMGHGITLRPGVHMERRTAQAFSPASSDHIGYGASLTVESGRIVLGPGFTPYATLTFDRVNADISAFSYTQTALFLGFERRF